MMTTLMPERVAPGSQPEADDHIADPGRPDRVSGGLKGDSNSWVWLRRKAVAVWMNILIAAAAGITVATAGNMSGRPWPEPGTWGVSALKLFTLWCLAFLPGWLYVRFLDLRARALWSEYVLSLHRLGWDLPWHLPMPPVASGFYDEWARGPHGRPVDNIYRQKFEAYYGRQITNATERRPAGLPTDAGRRPGDNYRVSSESLFPVFLATAVLAVGWAAVLWGTRFVSDPTGPWDVLKYGFLGAYAFVTSMLIRRFFQSDLRPSAYATVVFRIALVLLIVTVLHQVLRGTTAVGSRAEMAAAFVVGFFPLVGLQALQRVTSKVLRRFVPPVTSDYPLDQLDGFNLWYEARLTEEGVEDMQNLTTMNLVDVILHTRVRPGRLVDWIDQAFLLTHLEPVDRDELTRLRRANQRAAMGRAPLSGGAGPAEPQARRHPHRHRPAQGVLRRTGRPARLLPAGRPGTAAAGGPASAAGHRAGRRAGSGAGLELAAQRSAGMPGRRPADPTRRLRSSRSPTRSTWTGGPSGVMANRTRPSAISDSRCSSSLSGFMPYFSRMARKRDSWAAVSSRISTVAGMSTARRPIGSSTAS
jgi:hypothetical protein